MRSRSPRSQQRRQSGVSLVEFALVAPLFMIFIFLVIDFGKAIYVKNTLDSAAREAARSAVVLTSTYCSGSGEPTACDVETAAKKHSSDVALANPSPYCTPSAPTNGNSGYIFLSNMPGGDTATSGVCPDGSTYNVSPVSGNAPIKVTIEYCYKPLFPLLTAVLDLATSGNCKGGITMVSSSQMDTEY
jgi:Flp pilus assembly protein TadG